MKVFVYFVGVIVFVVVFLLLVFVQLEIMVGVNVVGIIDVLEVQCDLECDIQDDFVCLEDSYCFGNFEQC